MPLPLSTTRKDDLGTRRGEGSASHPGRFLPPGNTQYPLYRGLGGPQGQSWTGVENFTPTGIRSPDRPARSQSLYRLSSGFGGLVVSMLTSGTQDHGFEPGRSHQIFWAKKSTACLPSEGK
jgi:hypothetical protein